MRSRPYDIVKYPANVLERRAEEVPFGFEYFQEQFKRFERANTIHRGVGIAAPQLGISARFFYYDYEGERFLAINPEITHRADEFVTAVEGCLSVPGKSFKAERSEWLDWEYMNEDGDMVSERISGMKARIVQHELDHLNGECLPDKFERA